MAQHAAVIESPQPIIFGGGKTASSLLNLHFGIDADIGGSLAPPRTALAWMVREVAQMIVDVLKCSPRVEGDGERAINDGFGRRNNAVAIAAVEGIMAGLKPSRSGHTLKQRCLDVCACTTGCYMRPRREIPCFLMG